MPSARLKGGRKDGNRSYGSTSDEEDHNTIHDARFCFVSRLRKGSFETQNGMCSVVPVWRVVSAGVTRPISLALRMVFKAMKDRTDGHNNQDTGSKNEDVN